ncbi:unnamed protein product [Hyaloperonospora brassicae]|uniref:RxLR effector candidate protein n=1 Tax=Hyaloperonospora brassicae TaxID=162125 RepID=A0AAV0TIB3_HYABA|nr:unnamed protein product [Hyaloperonospora brassicae]
MRLSSSILLISAAVLTCNSSSGIPDVKRSTRDRSEAETDSADPVKRLLRTDDTADDESRTTLLPLATDLHVVDAVKRIEMQIPKTLNLSQMPSDMDRLIEQVIDLLNGRVSKSLSKPVMNGGRANRKGSKPKKGPKAQKEAHKAAIKAAEDNRELKEVSRKKKQTQQAKQREADVEEWLNEGLDADAVLGRLLENKDGFKILSESDLVALQRFLIKSKKKTGATSGYLLLRTLVEGFRDEAVVARMLSAAKGKEAKPTVASIAQTQLLQGWLDEGNDLDVVYNKMMTASDASPKDRVLEYTLADTMNIFIGLYNKKYPSKEVDPVGYLLKRAKDDSGVALMVFQAADMGLPVQALQHEVLSRWMHYRTYDPNQLSAYCFQKLGSKGSYYAGLMEKDFAKFRIKNHDVHAKQMARIQGNLRAS